MRTRLVLQFLPVFLLLVVTSDGFFFPHPKTALWNLYHALKGKEQKKAPVNNIHHYHLHYYPTPIQVVSHTAYAAPDKLHLDRTHDETLRSLGWSDTEYKLIPDNKITLPGSLQEPWLDSPGPWSPYDDHIIETAHPHDTLARQKQQRLILQVPVHQQIVINHRPSSAKKETKPNPITAFFQKLSRIKEALFSHDKDCEDKKEDVTTLTSKLNAYVVYFPKPVGHP